MHSPLDKRVTMPSRRATRLALLLLMPGVVVCAVNLPSWAQSLRRWNDGETLTADALNGQFDALRSYIDEALATERASPVRLSSDDARYDDLRFTLLHAAASGACGGILVDDLFAVRATIPKPVDQTCVDLCPTQDMTCIGSVSVGGLLTERASGRFSVGDSTRYGCDDEPTVAAFDEVALTAPESRERLNDAAAQYCCCEGER